MGEGQRTLEEMVNLLKKINSDYVFIFIYSLIVKLINCIASPFYPDFCFQADNAILYLMGREIARGKIVYKELADNKTPYIYFINALASLIEYRHIGIFIIEMILIVTTLILVYKICKLFLDDGKLSLIGAVIFSVLLNNAYITLGMSKTEGYVLPVMLSYFYIILNYYKNEEIGWSTKKSFALGALATFSFMMNQKTAFIYMPSYFILLIKLANIKTLRPVGSKKNVEASSDKDAKQNKIIKSILFSLLGAVVVMTPFIIYMALTNSFKEAYYCAITSALSYVARGSSYTYSNENILMSTLIFISSNIIYFIFIFVSILIVALKVKDKYIKWTFILSFVFTLLPVTAANKNFSYYLALFYPYFIPLYIAIANKFKTSAKEIKKVLLIFTSIFCFFITLIVGYRIVKNQYITRHNFNVEMKKVLNKYYDNLDDIKLLSVAFNPEVYMAVNMKLDFPYFITMNNTYQKVARYYNYQLRYIKNKEPDVVVIRPESTYIYFPIPMQEEIEGILATDYKRVEDVDSKSNYGMYNIYIKNK